MDKKFFDILKYGEEVLQLQAGKILSIDDEFIKFKKHLIDTMHNAATAIGLAAPQVGKSIQLSVIDLSQGENPNELLVLINPEIIEADGSDVDDEGCLSFPNIALPIKRNTRILLKNTDLDGKEIRKEIDGYLARVILHEMDHLNGITIIDRVSSLKRQLTKKEIKRLKRNEEW